MFGGVDRGAERLGQFGRLGVRVGHLQGGGVEGKRTRHRPVVRRQRDRGVQPHRPRLGVGDIGTERRKAVERGEALPGGVGRRDVRQQVGLDVQRGDADAVQVARRAQVEALRERAGPPREAATAPFEPVVLDLEAVDDEVQQRGFVLGIHGSTQAYMVQSDGERGADVQRIHAARHRNRHALVRGGKRDVRQPGALRAGQQGNRARDQRSGAAAVLRSRPW